MWLPPSWTTPGTRPHRRNPEDTAHHHHAQQAATRHLDSAPPRTSSKEFLNVIKARRGYTSSTTLWDIRDIRDRILPVPRSYSSRDEDQMTTYGGKQTSTPSQSTHGRSNSHLRYDAEQGYVRGSILLLISVCRVGGPPDSRGFRIPCFTDTTLTYYSSTALSPLRPPQHKASDMGAWSDGYPPISHMYPSTADRVTYMSEVCCEGAAGVLRERSAVCMTKLTCTSQLGSVVCAY